MTLLEKLKAATEGSRELDLEIAKHFRECDPEAWYDEEADCAVWNEPRDFGSTVAYERCGERLHDYTTSIDAALAFVRRKYPEHHWSLDSSDGKNSAHFVFWKKLDDWDGVYGTSETEELAICIALVKAEGSE